MVGTLVALGVLLLILAWFFWPSDDVDRNDLTPGRRPGVDQAELDAAERDVREAADEDSVRDWGPGVQKPPL